MRNDILRFASQSRHDPWAAERRAAAERAAAEHRAAAGPHPIPVTSQKFPGTSFLLYRPAARAPGARGAALGSWCYHSSVTAWLANLKKSFPTVHYFICH